MTSRKIKICNVVNDLGVGGVQRVVLDTVKNIDHQKFDVSLVLLSDSTEMLNHTTIPNGVTIKKIEYDFDTDYSLRSYLKSSFFKKVSRKKSEDVLNTIDDLSPDILHFHTLPRELIIGILSLECSHYELVYTDHSVRIGNDDSTFLKRNLLAIAYKKLYRRYNLISVSNAVLTCQKKYHWLNSNKINRLIENRIDLTDYEVAGYKEKSQLRIVYVSRLNEKKGLHFLLKAWKKLNLKSAKLTILGDGPLRDSLKEYALNYLNNSVEFKGMVKNVKHFLYNSDFAVFPSEREGLPIALLEKMAVGLPVIVNNIPELTDFIKHDYNGLVYKNESDLIDCINLLYTNHELRSELGKNARLSLEERFGNKNYAQEIAEFYYELLQNER